MDNKRFGASWIEGRPTVSVVVTTRNRDELLRETLESLLAQTIMLHEVIVVDDGGQGDTRAVVESFGAVYRYQANSGAQAARNAGAALTTGDWIAFLDDDDLWEPDRHELIGQLASTGQVDLIFTNFVKFDEDGLASTTEFDRYPASFWTGVERPVEGVVAVVGQFPSMRMFPHTPFWPSTVALHRDLYKRLGGWDVRLRGIRTEDFDFAFRAVRAGSLGLIWKPTLRYRSHKGNHAQMGKLVSLGRVGVWQHLLRYAELTSQERSGIFDAIRMSLREAHWSAFASADYKTVCSTAQQIGWRHLGLSAGAKTLWAHLALKRVK